MSQRRGADVVEDVLDLREWGESPEQWPQRLGMTAAAITKALYRAGRPDLARPIARVAQAHDRRKRCDKPCPGCGGPVSGDPARTWCSVRCWANSPRGRRFLSLAGQSRAAKRNVWEVS